MQHATSVENKVRELTAERNATLRDAERLGVQLVPGAELSVTQPAAAFDDSMEYARLISELAVMDNMNSASSSHFLALSGTQVRDLVARLQSAENREKLLRKMDRLERKLHLSERWTPESEEFKVSARAILDC